MRGAYPIAILLFGAGLIAGTLSDPPPSRIPPSHGEYRILAADFHVHAAPGDGALPPSALRREAARRGLDVIAVTNHNETIVSRVGARPSRDATLPLLIAGQEVTAPGFHVIAAGIREAVDWRQPARMVVEAIHAQGGIAIAAHPMRDYWHAYDDAALARLDGAEAAHPAGVESEEGRAELTAFFTRARALNPRLAPIGASDYHFQPPMGACRTYVFARDVSVKGVLDAVRDGRTVAVDAKRRFYGDPALVAVVEALPAPAGAAALSRSAQAAVALAWLGALGLIVTSRSARRTPRPASPQA